jgi:hypothetical protein
MRPKATTLAQLHPRLAVLFELVFVLESCPQSLFRANCTAAQIVPALRGQLLLSGLLASPEVYDSNLALRIA